MVSELPFEEKLIEIDRWSKNHNALPEKIAPIVMRRYLHSVHGDVEQTKKLIEYSYSLRGKYEKIFSNRDPLDADVQKILHVADLGIPMPSLTEQNFRIVFNRLIDYDAEKFDFDNVIKTFFLAADHRFSIVDEDLPLQVNEGDLPIFDLSGFSYKHLTKLTLSTLRCYMKFTQEAFPVRLKQIHLINVSPVLNKILMVLKPFMKARVSQMLQFHLPNSTTLYDHVPQELLPKEYGGEAGHMQEIKQNFLKRLESQREYLIDDAYWSPRDSNSNCTKQIEKSFRSLDID